MKKFTKEVNEQILYDGIKMELFVPSEFFKKFNKNSKRIIAFSLVILKHIITLIKMMTEIKLLKLHYAIR